MDYLHQELQLEADDVVDVTLDHPANVQLLDPDNFLAYQERHPYRYRAGGYVTHSPYRINAPEAGKWHLVIDLGGGVGTVRALSRLHHLLPWWVHLSCSGVALSFQRDNGDRENQESYAPPRNPHAGGNGNQRSDGI